MTYASSACARHRRSRNNNCNNNCTLMSCCQPVCQCVFCVCACWQATLLCCHVIMRTRNSRKFCRCTTKAAARRTVIEDNAGHKEWQERERCTAAMLIMCRMCVQLTLATRFSQLNSQLDSTRQPVQTLSKFKSPFAISSSSSSSSMCLCPFAPPVNCLCN